jgi:hypothetical protein
MGIKSSDRQQMSDNNEVLGWIQTEILPPLLPCPRLSITQLVQTSRLRAVEANQPPGKIPATEKGSRTGARF